MLPEPAASTGQYVLCGTLQFVFFLGYAWIAALVGARAYTWISVGSGLADIYLRSVLFGGAAFLVLCLLPILAKWVLIGRWKPREIRIWSLGYVRFWIVKTLVRSNPLAFLAVGSPLYTLYLRALGAKIGSGVVIFSRQVPVCADLLTIGADTVIRKDAFLLCYRAQGGYIQTGPVALGRNVFIGEKSVLDINTAMGDVSQLGHASALYSGQTVPTGQRWHGSPAQQTNLNYARVSPARCTALRRARFCTVTLLCVLLLYLPLAEGGVFLLLTEVPRLGQVLDPRMGGLTSRTLYIDALQLSLVGFFGLLFAGLAFVLTVPRLLSLFVKPAEVYPLYGFHDRIHRAITRMTSVKFFTHLFGDSSFIVYYLRCLGYDLSRIEQTGSNFGTEVGHETPYLSTIGSGTMVADGLSIMNADFSSTSFRVSPVSIGPDNFIGNNIAYPAGGRTGKNCLLATKTMIPLDGEIREGVGLLGSPPFEIPRSVERDLAFDDLRTGGETAHPPAREELAQPQDHGHLPDQPVAALVPGHRVRPGRLRCLRRVRATGDGGPVRGQRPDHPGLLCAAGTHHQGVPQAPAPVLLDLRPELLAARAAVEGAGRGIPAHVRRHSVQEPDLAWPRGPGRQAGVRRRLLPHRADACLYRR